MTALNGSAEWHGDLEGGSGTIVVGDAILEGPFSFQSRLGDALGTNRERLVAAALADCFTIGVTSLLTNVWHPLAGLHTTARVQLRNIDKAPTLRRIDLDINDEVPGADAATFQAVAEESKTTCPVARALRWHPRGRPDMSTGPSSSPAGTG